MQTHMEGTSDRAGNAPVQSEEKNDELKSTRILELRKKIESGFYDSKEVLSQIVDKMLNEIKRKNK